jgi:hypothetical protein
MKKEERGIALFVSYLKTSTRIFGFVLIAILPCARIAPNQQRYGTMRLGIGGVESAARSMKG